jgi:hypothetical protein
MTNRHMLWQLPSVEVFGPASDDTIHSTQRQMSSASHLETGPEDCDRE